LDFVYLLVISISLRRYFGEHLAEVLLHYKPKSSQRA
jgi:hypothetical protein